MEKEVWKTVGGFPDYQISNYGRLKSFKKNKVKILKQTPNSYNYIQYNLINGKILSKLYN